MSDDSDLFRALKITRLTRAIYVTNGLTSFQAGVVLTFTNATCESCPTVFVYKIKVARKAGEWN